MAKKVLGQAAPSAATSANLYTVPAGYEAVVATILICEYGGVATTFRVSVAPGGAAAVNQHRAYWDHPLSANRTFAATIGITLAAGDVIRVQSASGNVAFTAFGDEATV